jgi:hypothetical protein
VTVLTRRRFGIALPRGFLVVALVFCIALAALVSTRDGEGQHDRLPGGAAERAALSDPVVRRHVALHPFDRVRSAPLDERAVRVSFFDGRRIVLEAAVAPDGTVANVIRYSDGFVRVGSEVAQRPLMLATLVAVFLLATLRLPLRRGGNFDALALAALVVPVVLMNERYVEWSVLASTGLLGFLAVRCVLVAFGSSRHEPAEWLLDRLPGRVGRVALVGCAVGLVLLSIPGGLVSDVAFASLAGATELFHGSLPYGNLPHGGLVHGDTYPLLAYVAYLPAALLSPVGDAFDDLDGALWIATALALVTGGALAAAGRRRNEGGARLALAFLAFPPVVIATSSGSNDLAAAALVAVALAAGAHAGRSTAALSAAGWVKLAPLALVPLWVARSRAARPARAAWAAIAVTAGVAAVLVLLGGPAGLVDMLDAIGFQAERGSPLSPWAVLGAGGAQIVFQAAVLTGIALACVRVWRDAALAADPRRMAALGAAILLAIQLAANYWTYTYMAWVFPLVALALLGAASRSDPTSRAQGAADLSGTTRKIRTSNEG